ncbi:MAG: (d)CMP kinase [Smithellaceae bacterium]
MKPVITIDGPAGAGKSTVSKALAARLQYVYLDTGALYRALAYKALKNEMDVNNPDELAKLCSTTDVTLKNVNGKITVFVDGEDVGDKIRTEEVGLAASTLSAFPVVREKLLALQREAGARGGIVAEGRDMGSVVFPDAKAKFFLNANIEERIRRRHDELVQKNRPAGLSAISRDMQARDHQDSQRKIAPLIAAPDAIVIDSTSLDVSQVVEIIIKHISDAND